jgi:hypothetical protein
MAAFVSEINSYAGCGVGIGSGRGLVFLLRARGSLRLKLERTIRWLRRRTRGIYFH